MSDTHEDREVELQKYELGYHLVPSLGPDDLALRVAELVTMITEVEGKPISEGYPQSYVLAYTMHKLRGGKWDKYDTSFFGWIRFEAPSEGLPKLRDVLDHNEHLVRYLVIKLDESAFAPAPTAYVRTPSGEVVTEPKALVKRTDAEEKGAVSEEELDKQIEELIK